MGQIKVEKTFIDGLYVIEPTIHGDERGYFMETYNQRDMAENVDGGSGKLLMFIWRRGAYR